MRGEQIGPRLGGSLIRDSQAVNKNLIKAGGLLRRSQWNRKSHSRGKSGGKIDEPLQAGVDGHSGRKSRSIGRQADIERLCDRGSLVDRRLSARNQDNGPCIR